MTLEFKLSSTPITLAPGVETRVPLEVHNRASTPLAVRVSVARGRAAAWAYVEPPDITVDAGGTAAAEVVLEVPADQPPSPALVPFTVHAVELATGEPAGFASGLLTVAAPVPVVGDLVARDGKAHTYDLRLANDGATEAAVRVAAQLDPPSGVVTVEPSDVRIEPGGSVTTVVQAKPGRPVMGAPKPYFVVVKVTDAADPDRPPLLNATGRGTRKPWVANWLAATVAIVLALGITAVIALSGIRPLLPGARRAAPEPGTSAPEVVTVGRPYALLDVFPHRGEDGGRAAAEAAQARLAGAGMPVRLVDSLASDVLADQGTGFWVLLQDGFPSAEAAQAFCTQWKVVAPKCQVAS
ncbi:hypothetical protein GCM10022251_24030 [Phytohabitans flavus]|uniref:SPOR domain-containing protein n=1 Tax=Phytohabitans flavus TaxID=1076124 RepID=A0A6F8XRM8_9ACTN|nr:hypothetical protein [Phytohabitans flavus]BCB76401.1 hypothetical protein Pflav_028110 [Phytohabitans flavus]